MAEQKGSKLDNRRAFVKKSATAAAALGASARITNVVAQPQDRPPPRVLLTDPLDRFFFKYRSLVREGWLDEEMRAALREIAMDAFKNSFRVVRPQEVSEDCQPGDCDQDEVCDEGICVPDPDAT